MQESNSFLSSHNNELQNENKNLNERAVILQLSINEKNDELQEMKSILESKSNDLKSALKLVEVRKLNFLNMIIVFEFINNLLLLALRSYKRKNPL